MSQQLIVGNATTEYMFGNSLDSFSRKAVDKQHAMSTRTAWLLNNGDAMLSDRPLTPEFIDYLAGVLGIDQDTITFLVQDKASAGIEFLDHASLLDPDLVARLSEIVDHDWTIVPYIHDRSIGSLAHRLGLSTDANPPFFAQGGTDFFNSKAFFRAWTAGLGAPVPAGHVTRSRAATAAAVVELLPRTGSVIVKQDFSGSGYGNVLFTVDPDVPGLGVSDRHDVDAGITEEAVAVLLADTVPSVDRVRDFPTGLRPCESVVEVYHPYSRTLYSELEVPEPPAAPVMLDYGDMRMEPVWNGFAIPPVELPRTVEDAMLDWSTKMAEYLQQTGYRGYVNCDSLVTPEGELFFSEVNARVGGCTHIHYAAARVLGADYLRYYTLLTRNNLACGDFATLAKAVDNDALLNGRDRTTGALLVVDDVPYSGTIQYLVYGNTVPNALEAEQRLHDLAASC
jgi:hypothetical protein